MDSVLEYVDLFMKIVILFICTVYLYNAIINLVKDKKVIQYYFYLLFYFFYIFPIMLQLCFSNYEYITFWRVNEAMNHAVPNIMYDFFVLIFATVIMKTGRRVKIEKYKLFLANNKLIIQVCTIIIVISFIATVTITGFTSLFSFGYAYMSDIDINESLTGCGVIAFLILLGYKRFISKTRIIFMTILVIGIVWLVGKRYIIAETLIMSIYILSMVGSIKGKQFLKYLFFGGIFVIVFCVVYGFYFKDNLTSIVEYFMVDMSRQYTLVYQFYCDIIGKNISVEQFDAILWLLGCWIPRSIWPNKPLPFVNQLTYSMVSSSNIPSEVNMGWATTCGIFSDLFDSFSILGLVLGIGLFVKLFRVIQNTSKPHYKVLFMYLTIRLLTVQMSSAIVQIILMFAIIGLCDKLGKNEFKSVEC